MTIIRLATKSDCSELVCLNEVVQDIHARAVPHLFKSDPDPEQLRDFFVHIMDDPDAYIFLLEVEGTAAGYLYLQIMRRPENALMHAYDLVYIHHIAVDRQQQGQGFGSRLLEAAFELARQEGISQVALDTWSFNENAQSFFERRGFNTFNVRMNLMLPPLN